MIPTDGRPRPTSSARAPKNADPNPSGYEDAEAEDTHAGGNGGASPLERIKELEFEQAGRLRSATRAILSLSFLRQAARRFLGRTLPAGARPVPRPAAGTVALTWGGHATVMITTPRLRILVDPMLDLTLHGLPRVRAAALAEGDLEDVGLVLITQATPDHLSRSTLDRLSRRATIIVPPGCEPLVEKLGFADVIELGARQAHDRDGVRVTAVPGHQANRHGGFDGRRRGANGYVVAVADGDHVIYVAGDTGYFAGLSEIGRRFAPDVAVLPIGGYQPAPFRRQRLSPLDALYAFEDVRARVMVPISYGSFLRSYEPFEEPLTWLSQAAAARGVTDSLVVLDHGQTCLIRRRRG